MNNKLPLFLLLALFGFLAFTQAQNLRPGSSNASTVHQGKMTQEIQEIIRYYNSTYLPYGWNVPIYGGSVGGYNSLSGGYVAWNYMLPNGTVVGGYEGWGANGQRGGYVSWTDGKTGGYNGWNAGPGGVISGGYEAGIDGSYRGWNGKS